jgi:hypothetical protein
MRTSLDHRVISNLLDQVNSLKSALPKLDSLSTLNKQQNLPTVGVLTGISYVSGVDYYQVMFSVTPWLYPTIVLTRE